MANGLWRAAEAGVELCLNRRASFSLGVHDGNIELSVVLSDGTTDFDPPQIRTLSASLDAVRRLSGHILATLGSVS